MNAAHPSARHASPHRHATPIVETHTIRHNVSPTKGHQTTPVDVGMATDDSQTNKQLGTQHSVCVCVRGPLNKQVDWKNSD
mmetsp:Transcript_10258/g.24814  ORF Transcript_10258/g.24814 Transcript_10258/m.24814 type:complete len:81 (-) Transcript_10258:208-450(-)